MTYYNPSQKKTTDTSEKTPFWVKIMLLMFGVAFSVIVWIIAEWVLQALICFPDAEVPCTEADGFGKFVIQTFIVAVGVSGIIIGLLIPIDVSWIVKLAVGVVLGVGLSFAFLQTHNVNMHGCPKEATSVPINCPASGTVNPKADDPIVNPWDSINKKKKNKN